MDEGVIYFISFIIALVLGWIGYSVAENNGQPGCIFGILCFITPCLGFIVLLIVILVSNSSRGHAQQHAGGGNRPQSMYGGPRQKPTGPTEPPKQLDPDFYDSELDRLIENGEFREAKKYLKEMMDMAVEMNDVKGMANYGQYEKKIIKAQGSTKNANRGRYGY